MDPCKMNRDLTGIFIHMACTNVYRYSNTLHCYSIESRNNFFLHSYYTTLKKSSELIQSLYNIIVK